MWYLGPSGTIFLIVHSFYLKMNCLLTTLKQFISHLQSATNTPLVPTKSKGTIFALKKWLSSLCLRGSEFIYLLQLLLLPLLHHLHYCYYQICYCRFCLLALTPTINSGVSMKMINSKEHNGMPLTCYQGMLSSNNNSGSTDI